MLHPEIYLWLAPTLIVPNMATQGPRLGRGLVKEEGKDRIAPHVEFSLNVCHPYNSQLQLNACTRMIEYLQLVPVEKDERCRLTSTFNKDTNTLQSWSAQYYSTAVSFQVTPVVNFISTLLSAHGTTCRAVDEVEKPSLEKLDRKLVGTALVYTQSVSRLVDIPLRSEPWILAWFCFTASPLRGHR